MTDAVLLERLARGEPEALGAVFDRHASAVTRYAWVLASDRLQRPRAKHRADELRDDVLATSGIDLRDSWA